MSYMNAIFRVPFFVRKTACQKYFFQILSQGKIVNLKNPDLDLIRRIHLECGFYGFMIRFWIRKSGLEFFPKNASYVLSQLPGVCYFQR